MTTQLFVAPTPVLDRRLKMKTLASIFTLQSRMSSRSLNLISAIFGLGCVLAMQAGKGVPAQEPIATSVVVDYASDGWRYRVVEHDVLRGFESLSFDDSSFRTGKAAFGTHSSCHLNGDVSTEWRTNTDILLRREIILPPGIVGLRVAIAVDNDIQVFLNGVELSNGFVTHENCPEHDSSIFHADSNLIKPGSNLFAARARDRGSQSFIDAKIEIDTSIVLLEELVSLVLPSGLHDFGADNVIEIEANIQGLEDHVARVEFYVGDRLIYSDTEAPFVAPWLPSTPDDSVLVAVVTLDSGQVLCSRELSVEFPENTPPTIEGIPPQKARVGEKLVGIPIKVSDAESELGDLVIVAESLDTARLPNELLTVTEQSGDDRSLAIASLDRPTGSTAIPIRVTAMDEQGATSSTEFSLTVLNDLPTVEIVEPSDYAIIAIPGGAEAVDVSVGILTNDDQPVAEVQLLLNSVVIEEAVGVSSSIAGRFETTLSALRTGEYTLTASARDAATGELVLSPSVYIKVVAGGDGEIAIVHPANENRTEVFAVWDYLVDLGYQPQVFLQEEISVEVLSDYRTVIWHDLGSLDLLDQTVEVLSNLQETLNMPIYFMGTQLESAVVGVSHETREKWREMTKVQGSLGRVALNPVVFGEADDSDRSLVGDYWALVDGFALDGETDALEVDLDAQILAVAGDEESVLVHRFPSLDGNDLEAPRRFVQAFPLRIYGDEFASFARRVLFENALCFLLAKNIVEDCECPNSNIADRSIREFNESVIVSVGEIFEIDFFLYNDGRCPLRGGQLEVSLGDGMSLAGISSSKRVPSRWDEETQKAYLGIGRMETQSNAEDIMMTLSVETSQTGTYPLAMRLSGNHYEGEERLLLNVIVKGALLSVEQDMVGQPVLVVSGVPNSSVQIEWSSDLRDAGHWQSLQNIAFSSDESERRIPLGTLGEQRFFRVVGF